MLSFYVHGSSSLFVYDDIAVSSTCSRSRSIPPQLLSSCMHHYKKETLPFFCVACNVMYKDMYVHHIEYKICCCVFLNHSIHSYE